MESFETSFNSTNYIALLQHIKIKDKHILSYICN